MDITSTSFPPNIAFNLKFQYHLDLVDFFKDLVVFLHFFDSWISNHPRKTGEAYINQYLEAKFINNNPVPKGISFTELKKFFQS